MKVLSTSSQNLTRTPRRSRGFTLVELVIVLTIIGLLAGSSIYLIIGFVDEAKIKRVDGDLRTISTAIAGYERNNYFRPPTQEQGLAALVTKPTSEPQPKMWIAYLKEIPLDPWGQEYQYRIPATKNSSGKYDLFSLGEDGVEGDDDIGNWSQ
jgi:general secretion pathway protein G